MDITIVIPVYNEQSRIGKTMDRVVEYLQSRDFNSRVLVINDGSTDGTIEVIGQYCKTNIPVDIFSLNPNQGKGAAVKRGLELAESDYVLFSDADLSTPIEELDRMITLIEEGYDIVIGSRAIAGSNIAQRQSLGRQSMGRIFNKLVQIFVFSGIKDTQCGFKLFRTNVAKKIVKYQVIKRFAFDVELLYIAQKFGYKILETPVTWKHVKFSRVNVLKDALNMFFSILFIRYIHRKL